MNRIIENKISSKFKLNLVKKQTITKENIDSYMLNLVPGIGIQTAKEILNNYNGEIHNLISAIEKDEDTLKNIKINNRKISSKVISNIKEYLKK